MLRRLVIVLGVCVVAAIVVVGGRLPAGVSGETTPGGTSATGGDGIRRLGQAVLADEAVVTLLLKLAREAGFDTTAKDAVPALADALAASRQAALAAGSEPIPPAIRRKLDGFFPTPMLARVRYRVGWGDKRPPLAPLFLLPTTKAMTLDEVIVFRDRRSAEDIRIWVHELGHVEQYARWGVEGFAQRYVEDYQAVEDDAWAVFNRYDEWARAAGRLAATDYEPVPATR